MSSELRYWVGFNKTKGIGPVRLRALVEHFGSVQTAWAASPAALRAANILDDRSLYSLLHTRPTLDLDTELRKLDALHIRVLTLDDTDYPAALRKIMDAPPVLYVRGTLLEADQLAIAVVGTRRATTYGKATSHAIVSALANQGITIVSGLAYGIDAVAHQAALEAGGRTIAVLPCGLDTIYPPEHKALAQRICEQGALVSENPLGEDAERIHFVPRNRIISGLCAGVVVVEAGEKSGSLITADLALDQGRDVFAVPGNIQSQASQGTNRLIQNGAKVVLSAADVLDELNIASHPVRPRPRATSGVAIEEPSRTAMDVDAMIEVDDATEAALLRLLATEPRHLDDLALAVNVPIGKVAAALSTLTLKGLVTEIGVREYARSTSP
ncbi:MAG: DNA-processing protein DprA [Anaerolineae bacterium]|nr:DNA-processing protein DprA [Anaerolineae bacterium]